MSQLKKIKLTNISCTTLPQEAKAYPVSMHNIQPMRVDLGEWEVDGKKARIAICIDWTAVPKLIRQLYVAQNHAKFFGDGALHVFRICGPGCPKDWDSSEDG